MRFFLIFWTALLLLSSSAYATPAGTLQNLYVNPESRKLPVVIIFYSSANTCENCHTAIDSLITVLKQNYEGKLHAYLIDTAKHPEFISAFKLQGPLNLVVIRISDGASFGYDKLAAVQSLSQNFAPFSRRITEFINNFLGF